MMDVFVIPGLELNKATNPNRVVASRFSEMTMPASNANIQGDRDFDHF